VTRLAVARSPERYHPFIEISEQKPSPDGREMSRRAAIVLGALVAAVGLGVLALAFWAPGEKFHAPRWVVAACGGAFVFFGGWTAVVYALGYDPRRSEETLPPPLVQLAFFAPGLAMFALPFHWVAFGPGPRAFSGSFSLPFVMVSRRSGELSGRILFGIGAVLIDLIILGICVKLIRKAARE
jgi:xanthine/uracil permease